MNISLRKKFLLILSACVLLASGFFISGCQEINSEPAANQENQVLVGEKSGQQILPNNIPAYSGQPYAVINNNVPFFTEKEIVTESYEYYSPLDDLGRCQAASACLGKDLMPTQERGNIGMVKPTGWQTAKYDFVDGKYLYNRCHLIAFCLAGENANNKNLITGTRYMNTEGMLPFETKVAKYVEKSGNHVMYRVTPMFEGNNLLASGVLMEALSAEDKGKSVCFNIFCYNIQPGVDIDYADGSNQKAGTQKAAVQQQQNIGSNYYVGNKSSKKYHLPTCSGAQNMNAKNKVVINSKPEAEAAGYSPCGICKP